MKEYFRTNQKLLRIPATTPNWTIDFLKDRKQRDKMANDCFSEWGNVPAGVPQGTKLGPLLMINDLRCTKIKLLGLTIQSDPKWNTHIDNIISKCSKRLYTSWFS